MAYNTSSSNYGDLYAPLPGQAPNLHRRILESFIDGAELSVVSALREHKTIELRKIVSDLRKSGVPVADRWASNVGNTKRFKVYFLHE